MRLFFSLALLVLLAACTSDVQVTQNTPEEAIRGLFQALKTDDFERGKLFLTNGSRESLQHFETNLKMSNKEDLAELMAPFKMEVLTVTCSENQGTTTCNICCFNEAEASIEMMQQDDKWFAKMEFVY
jgi:hypothetical protein